VSIIAARRLDPRGKPLGDLMPAVAVQNARLLAAVATDDGVALAWWTWSAVPAVQNVTWLDAELNPRGKPIVLARGELSEPVMDLRPTAGGVRAVWLESTDGIDHVLSGELSRAGVTKKTDLGVGDEPTLGGDTVVYTTLTDGAVFRAPFG